MRSFTRVEFKMAAKEMCSSCFRDTGYRCLVCSNPFCNQCSIFERDEDSPGWIMGKSVAYCQECYKEKQTATSRSAAHDDISDVSRSSSVSQPDQNTRDGSSTSESSLKRYVNGCTIDRLEELL